MLIVAAYMERAKCFECLLFAFPRDLRLSVLERQKQLTTYRPTNIPTQFIQVS